MWTVCWFASIGFFGYLRFFCWIWSLKVEDHEAKLNLCQKDWRIRGCRILWGSDGFCLKCTLTMKKLDMFNIVSHRCKGTAWVLWEHYLIKEVPLFLIYLNLLHPCWWRHAGARAKPRQAATKHFAGVGGSYFLMCFHIHEHSWFNLFHEFPMLLTSSPMRSSCRWNIWSDGPIVWADPSRCSRTLLDNRNLHAVEISHKKQVYLLNSCWSW